MLLQATWKSYTCRADIVVRAPRPRAYKELLYMNAASADQR